MTDQNFEADVIDLAGDYYEQQLEAIEAMNLENNTIMVIDVEFYPGSEKVISYRLHKKLNELRGREVFYILATYPVTFTEYDYFGYDKLEDTLSLLGILIADQKVVSVRLPRRF